MLAENLLIADGLCKVNSGSEKLVSQVERSLFSCIFFCAQYGFSCHITWKWAPLALRTWQVRVKVSAAASALLGSAESMVSLSLL